MGTSGASAPQAGHIEPEPPEWQPRAIWVGGRLLCGSISFFFASFVFAYFYLRALDTNHSFVIGSVHPSQGLGAAIMALYVVGAVIYRLAAKRGEVDEMAAGMIAVVLTLVAVALTFVQYTTLDFGAASGGYAAVFFGWTSIYAIVALMGVYWVETQTASLWRIRREGTMRDTELATHEAVLLRAGVEAASFYWLYFALIGLLAWVLLYLIGP
jgi:heme/copper-type cytochrome/quinol oxidase subunit 3